ncbi:MAG TPA: imidazoleglycerol-phosphate dehydratase, partial [Candidatus Tectomicrobia bacterium]
MSARRTGSISRTTKETDIQVTLTLEGSGVSDITT